MNDQIRKSKLDDGQIEKILGSLRDEHVPVVPPQLLKCQIVTGNKVTQKNRFAPLTAWMTGVAAVILALIVLANMFLPGRDKLNLSNRIPPLDTPSENTRDQTEVSVQNLITLRPFERLEREMEEMKSEIEKLKVEAASLDAIRKVNAMMALN